MKPNYDLAVSESIRTLQDFGYNEVPIKVGIVLRALRRTIKVQSYSSFSQKHGISIDEIVEYFESDLGACAYNHKREQYIVYYNDTKQKVGLARFTIAHELGHIFLEHHNKANTNVLLRKGISQSLYSVFEKEANCFARNFLAPYPLVTMMTEIGSPLAQDEIMEGFNISYDASINRLRFLKLDSYRCTAEHMTYFSSYHIHLGDYCLTCKNGEIKPASICKICGEKDSVAFKGVNRMFYRDGVETDENLRVLRCPNCDNEEIGKTAEYCKICGTKVINYCTGNKSYDHFGNVEDVEYHKNSSNARYCEICGEKTEYFENKFLKSWKEYEEESEELESSYNPADVFDL